MSCTELPMDLNGIESNPSNASNDAEAEEIDPIADIIDYLVRCANISFKNAHVDEAEIRTREKIRLAHSLYTQSTTNFLQQFGKHLAPHHVDYFENLPTENGPEGEILQKCIKELKTYHSEDSRRKRTRNRRYSALQKLKDERDYFSEKEMMFRNPLLYEQLVGQFLTDDEVRARDGADSENLTLVKMIMDTVDRNNMRERKNEQNLSEGVEEKYSEKVSVKEKKPRKTPLWGEFDTPEERMTESARSFKPEVRKQACISAPERQLLREEFLQEMYSSFIEGRDIDVDYNSIDNDEQFDDLQQVSQDAEDKYFDSEPTDVDNLEEHMKLVEVYGKKNSNDANAEDTLDMFMDHLNKRCVE